MKAQGRNPEKVSGPRCVWRVVGERTERRKKRKETRGRKRKEEEGQVDRERQDDPVTPASGSSLGCHSSCPGGWPSAASLGGEAAVGFRPAQPHPTHLKWA